MMEHLAENATVTDVFDTEEVYVDATEAYDFDGKTSFINFCKQNVRARKVLKKRGVELHETVVMMSLLSQFKSNGNFEKEVTEWEAKTTGKGWDEFVKHFSTADHNRRRRIKFGKKAAGESMYANNVMDINSLKGQLSNELSKQLAKGLAEVVSAAQQEVHDSVNMAVGSKDTSSSTSSSSDSDMAKEIAKLRKEMKEVKEENKKLKSGKGNRNGNKKMTTKCSHCNRWHCFALPANAGKAPAGWKKADE